TSVSSCLHEQRAHDPAGMDGLHGHQYPGSWRLEQCRCGCRPLVLVLTCSSLLLSDDSSRIFVAVGFGFFVEMNLDEALRFIDRKTTQLTA
ncbi:hypothetical protein XENOCAPTIV_021847, partial [Xenoophorus captivus]